MLYLSKGYLAAAFTASWCHYSQSAFKFKYPGSSLPRARAFDVFFVLHNTVTSLELYLQIRLFTGTIVRKFIKVNSFGDFWRRRNSE